MEEIRNNEIVDVIIYDIGLPSNYLKDLDAINKKEEERSKTLGLPYTPNQATYKEGGINLKYAVITRSKDRAEPIENVFLTDDNGDLEEPKYVCYGTIAQYPPRVLFDKKWNMSQKGGSSKSKDGKPEIINILPSAYVCQDWSNPDRETRVSADKIPVEFEYKYKDLIEQERERINSWTDKIISFENLNEENSIRVLLIAISRRFMICKKVLDKYEYLIPTIGTVFRAKIKKNESKYLNLTPFEFIKEPSGKWICSIYSTLDCNEPTKEEKDYALQIRELRSKNKPSNQQNLGITLTDEEDEESPF